MTDTEKFVAIEKANGVDLEFLGNLTWFTITDCRIKRADLEAMFTEAGIDNAYMPKEINKRDAFRRAAKVGEVKKAPLNDDQFLNVMVRDVRQDKDNIIKQLVREVVDAKNERLEYKPVANLSLFDELHVIPIVDMNYSERLAASKIESAFEIEKENYDGRTIRNIVMNVLKDCKPVAVRPSGGVYFVPQEYQPIIDSLRVFVERASDHSITGFKSRLYKVPVVNAEEQLQMLEESLEDQVKAEAGSMVEEMTKLIKSGKDISQSAAAKYIQRVKDLSNMVKRYEEMLNTQIVEAQADLELVTKQAMKVLDKVEAAA
ncbi:MAG: hypothetical protein A4E53_02272 [Pelotomaculum sp. PtaB.Bin104]|nr:MAG: hypothetical protein A4E53_02272 [Pelotomaculum sp. PtaB.Bin104]